MITLSFCGHGPANSLITTGEAFKFVLEYCLVSARMQVLSMSREYVRLRIPRYMTADETISLTGTEAEMEPIMKAISVAWDITCLRDIPNSRSETLAASLGSPRMRELARGTDDSVPLLAGLIVLGLNDAALETEMERMRLLGLSAIALLGQFSLDSGRHPDGLVEEFYANAIYVRVLTENGTRIDLRALIELAVQSMRPMLVLARELQVGMEIMPKRYAA